MCIFFLLFLLSLGIVCFTIIYEQFLRKVPSIKDKHVFITGGSSGIGLSAAKECIKRGAKVTLVARDLQKLQDAEILLENICKERGGSRVQVFSLDIGGDVKNICDCVKQSEAAFGSIHVLINCAGFAKAAQFEDLSPDVVKDMMAVNYFGSFFVTQEVVRGMKSRGEGGVVVFTSSMAGLLGLFGFTAYSGAKAALVKMAEALRMELCPHRIQVSVCLPPDTDTPGLANENKTKPIETKKISESAGLFQPEVVAKAMLDDALLGRFMSTVGLDGFMLSTLCGGMGPVLSCTQLFSELTFHSLFRLISIFYLESFRRIVAGQHHDKNAKKKAA